MGNVADSSLSHGQNEDGIENENYTSSNLSNDDDNEVDSPTNVELESSFATSATSFSQDAKNKFKGFPGSSFLEKTFCGSIDTTDPAEYEHINVAQRLIKKADVMCVSSPQSASKTFSDDEDDHDRDHEPATFANNTDSRKPNEIKSKKKKGSSKLFARALVSEVTDNPKTMTPAEMASREKKLLKAQKAAKKGARGGTAREAAESQESAPKPVGVPGGVGPPHVISSLAFACTGDERAGHTVMAPIEGCGGVTLPGKGKNTNMVPSSMQESNAHDDSLAAAVAACSTPDVSADDPNTDADNYHNPFAVTIGLSLSRRHSTVGHPNTVTRQTAFDFNEIQDRQYKYVSSTDTLGWRAGGGERGNMEADTAKTGSSKDNHNTTSISTMGNNNERQDKEAAPDAVHIPIIQIDCQSEEEVDSIIHTLASGEIFIPHMAILPEALSVNGVSPPDLVVRFGCDRNEDLPADDWPNWCLEFMHNQLYEYFFNAGAVWTERPFSITLARKVRWKTVKHMNRYFSHAERVIEAWREKGPQYLDPQLSYIEGGATPEEVARPHGIYLFRKGVPTNYFCPNFEPPYTTKMTRSLLNNVVSKSWDKKRREWTSQPIPKIVSPTTLLAAACGCADTSAGGYMAQQVTSVHHTQKQLSTGEEEKRREQQKAAAIAAEALAAEQGALQHRSSSSSPTKKQQYQHDTFVEEKKDDDSYSDASQSSASFSESSVSSSERQDRQSPPKAYQEQRQREHERTSHDDKQGSTAYASSAAASSTTVMHTNNAASDTVATVTDDIDNLIIGNASSQYGNNSKFKDKAGMQQLKAALLREEQLQNELMNVVKTTAGEIKNKKKKSNISDSAVNSKSSGYTMLPRLPAQKKGHKNKNSDPESPLVETNVSLEYSTDGSNFLPSDHQQKAGSNLSSLLKLPGKNRNRGSNPSSSPSSKNNRKSSKKKKNSGTGDRYDSEVAVENEKKKRESPATEMRRNKINMRMEKETVASDSGKIPTDQELMKVGWAKAMDSSSGNYYYFTLDRSKTVWDNPLLKSRPDAPE